MNKGGQDNDMDGLDSIRDLVNWVADEIEKEDKAKAKESIMISPDGETRFLDSVTGLDDMKEVESPVTCELDNKLRKDIKTLMNRPNDKL